MSIASTLSRAAAGEDLHAEEMEAFMRTIMRGEATPEEMRDFLVALRTKGETVEEIAAAARVMREFAVRVEIDDPHLVDIVGTGGDGTHTFNISTTAAFVAAAAGGKVAKHNNRSVSSRSGSADVLEAAGVFLGLGPREIADCIRETGVGFMYAPAHHGATRHAAGVRRELGTRTVFNLLGPLTNPADVRNRLIGVYAREWVRPVAEVMQCLGGVNVLVVHARDGMDEISTSCTTWAAELRAGKIRELEIDPVQLGFTPGDRREIEVDGAQRSLALMHSVLDNRPGPALDVVLINAGAAIYVAGLAPDIPAGIALARDAIASGGAKRKLASLVAFTSRIRASQ